MHVVATAGHVDHGKSALIRALTGMEPDRWAEERRRGMTIDLGYAWTELPGAGEMAFVDVPGHERFTTNMLAGVGPVPAVLLVVAADGGWSAQTAEHVAALDALGVDHGVLAVTRADLADPSAALAEAADRLEGTSLGPLSGVAVSVRTGAGLGDLRAALSGLAAALPSPVTGGRVRLWVDRVFTVRGFGTVLTGTLGSGSLAVGDALELGGEMVTVRGLECLGRPTGQVSAVARVAVNLRGRPAQAVQRGDALLTPDGWHLTAQVDVRLTASEVPALPRQLVLHIGSAAVPVDQRALGPRHLRLGLRRRVPLQLGDRALLRDPGRRQVCSGVVVLDPMPPGLDRRGAARARAGTLEEMGEAPDLAAEVTRRGAIHRRLLERIGVDAGALPDGAREEAGWLIDAVTWEGWCRALAALVDAADSRTDRLVRQGVAEGEAVRELGLPELRLLAPLVAAGRGLVLVEGHVCRERAGRRLDEATAAALGPVLSRLDGDPFAAPEAADLAAAGLGPRQLAAAASAGLILVLPDQVVLRPDAPSEAVTLLEALPAPFTLSAARQALGTTRRVAVPLLEHLDRLALTRRVDNSRRTLIRRGRS